MTYPTNFIGIDIETPGLEPHSNSLILEIAMIYVENMEIVKAFNGICPNHGDNLWEYGFGNTGDSIALEMHQSNGLLKEILSQENRTFSLEKEAYNWIESLKCTEKLYMFGSSVHFDRKWIRHCMTGLHSLFHYRNIDVSSVRTFMEQAGYHTHQDSGGHRAMPDLLSSFNCYKDMLKQVKK